MLFFYEKAKILKQPFEIFMYFVYVKIFNFHTKLFKYCIFHESLPSKIPY